MIINRIDVNFLFVFTHNFKKITTFKYLIKYVKYLGAQRTNE